MKATKPRRLKASPRTTAWRNLYLEKLELSGNPRIAARKANVFVRAVEAEQARDPEFRRECGEAVGRAAEKMRAKVDAAEQRLDAARSRAGWTPADRGANGLAGG